MFSDVKVPTCECGQLGWAGKIRASNGVWMWGYYCWDCFKLLKYNGRTWQPHINVDLDVIDEIKVKKETDWVRQAHEQLGILLERC